MTFLVFHNAWKSLADINEELDNAIKEFQTLLQDKRSIVLDMTYKIVSGLQECTHLLHTSWLTL